ncbi:MAG TPA: hypothetical protein VN950_05180 [Terriglobales bacterium]|nr:hypothetical protein [Terriglobales bacterium]
MIELVKLKPNTRHMHAGELKPLLKSLATEGGVNLEDPEFRFTLWVENGNYFCYEGHAAHDHLTGPLLAKGALRDKTRLAVLDAREDHIYLWSQQVG